MAAATAAALLISRRRLVSASRCFTAWKEPIGRPKAIRSFAYCQRHLKVPVHGADRLRHSKDAGDGQLALEDSRRILSLATQRRRHRDTGAVEADFGELTGDIKAVERSDGYAGIVWPNEELEHSLIAGRGRQKPGSAVAIRERGLPGRTVHSPLAARAARTPGSSKPSPWPAVAQAADSAPASKSG